MIQSTPTSSNTVLAGGILLLALLAGTLLYFSGLPAGPAPPPNVRASNPVIDYEVTASDITVDWAAGQAVSKRLSAILVFLCFSGKKDSTT